MSDRFVNLEIGGAPLVMYGAIATTVAVIAYATVSGGFGDSAAKAIGMQTVPSPSLSPSPSSESPKESSPNESSPKESSTEAEESPNKGGKRSKKGGSKKKKASNKKHRKTPRR